MIFLQKFIFLFIRYIKKQKLQLPFKVYDIPSLQLDGWEYGGIRARVWRLTNIVKTKPGGGACPHQIVYLALDALKIAFTIF
jgi:hypothetical protein